jgi:hypothetical protein
MTFDKSGPRRGVLVPRQGRSTLWFWRRPNPKGAAAYLMHSTGKNHVHGTRLLRSH